MNCKMVITFALVLAAALCLASRARGEGIWLSHAEAATLPSSGPAWEELKAQALGSWGAPNLVNQDVKHGLKVLGGAHYYLRTGDAGVRAKVKDGILAAMATMDGGPEFTTSNGVLSLGRQLGAYVIAADEVNLAELDPAAHQAFSAWLRLVTTSSIGNHGNWSILRRTAEHSPNNWGTFARASYLIASMYLRDDAAVLRSDSLFRAWLGERDRYPRDAPWPDAWSAIEPDNPITFRAADYMIAVAGGYFPASNSLTYSCNPIAWTAVNPLGCARDGHDLSGAVVEDLIRSAYSWPPGSSGMSYSWEALQGAYVEAEVLYRLGFPAYGYSDQALRRATDFMERAGWGITTPGRHVPWIANARYGEDYPTMTPVPEGRMMRYTDWTHAEAHQAPPPDSLPPPIDSLPPPIDTTVVDTLGTGERDALIAGLITSLAALSIAVAGVVAWMRRKK